jgi:ADP-dependent NAD(P)H-hydrate dehydratase / NAD(P)H-hydrate epimerase
MNAAQILTAEQMRSAEQNLFDAGTSVSELMEIAAGGAAEWVRRIAAGRAVTVLCGPGNNGGDGYVIARRLRDAGNAVRVIAPLAPATDAARAAREAWGAVVAAGDDNEPGELLVDCLFGSGLARPLSDEHAALLTGLAKRHRIRIAVDLPSGIASDTGELLNQSLPDFSLTLALGAWKFAHWSLPGRTKMGQMRLVPIGIAGVTGAAQLIERPRLSAPATDSHKYRRGLLAVVAGAMPGASLLSAAAAQHAGAGYVKLMGDPAGTVPPELVRDTRPLPHALEDERIGCILIGQGLGRDADAKERLDEAIAARCPLVLDADALVLLTSDKLPRNLPILATPHDGELKALAATFAVTATTRRETALQMAKASGMVICAKGPDTLIAAPDGRLALAPPASSWLSVAGTGDVLAGIAAGRMATGADPFTAACEAVWLHGEAARLSGAAFTPSQLACNVAKALAATL